MQFELLDSQEQLEKIKEAKEYNIIFKHNTTCPISRGAKTRFDQETHPIPGVASVYLVDILQNRDVSDAITRTFGVEHQSPQLLLVKDGQCTYNESLSSISTEAVAEAISK